jgi:hypothetical protein
MDDREESNGPVPHHPLRFTACLADGPSAPTVVIHEDEEPLAVVGETRG